MRERYESPSGWTAPQQARSGAQTGNRTAAKETKRSAAAAALRVRLSVRPSVPVTNDNGSGETASLSETWKCPLGAAAAAAAVTSFAAAVTAGKRKCDAESKHA